jgi:hypothetical protein
MMFIRLIRSMRRPLPARRHSLRRALFRPVVEGLEPKILPAAFTGTAAQLAALRQDIQQHLAAGTDPAAIAHDLATFLTISTDVATLNQTLQALTAALEDSEDDTGVAVIDTAVADIASGLTLSSEDVGSAMNSFADIVFLDGSDFDVDPRFLLDRRHAAAEDPIDFDKEPSPFDGPENVFLIYTQNTYYIPIAQPHSGSGGSGPSSGGTEETGPSLFARTFLGEGPPTSFASGPISDSAPDKDFRNPALPDRSAADGKPQPQALMAPLSQGAEATVAPLLCGGRASNPQRPVEADFQQLFDNALRLPFSPRTPSGRSPGGPTSSLEGVAPKPNSPAQEGDRGLQPALVDACFGSAADGAAAPVCVLAAAVCGDLLSPLGDSGNPRRRYWDVRG